MARLSPGAPRHSQTLPSAPRCSQTFPGAPGAPRDSQALSGVPRRSPALPDAPRRSQAPPDAPRRSRTLPGARRHSQALTEAPRRSHALPDAPRRCQTLLGWLLLTTNPDVKQFRMNDKAKELGVRVSEQVSPAKTAAHMTTPLHNMGLFMDNGGSRTMECLAWPSPSLCLGRGQPRI